MAKSKLLAPGGNKEMVYRNLNAGADAVFIGAHGNSRRWGSRFEFYHNEIKELAASVGEDKKLYVVLNRTQFPPELKEENFDFIVNRKVKDYLDWGIDSIILGNYELMKRMREKYPDRLEIVASVGCNIRDEEGLKKARDNGANTVVPCSELNVDEIISLTEPANDYDLNIEVLTQGTNCHGGVGGCSLYKFFDKALEVKEYEDSDGFRTTKIQGDPENGGGCYRPCLLLNDPLIKSKVPDQVLKMYEQEYSKKFNHASDIPRLVHEAGITSFKVQGREYDPEIIADIVGIYRQVINKSVESPKPEIRKELEYLNELNGKIEFQRKKINKKLRDLLLSYYN